MADNSAIIRLSDRVSSKQPFPCHQKYSFLPFTLAVFPGGFLPSLTLLVQTLTTGSRGRLVVDSIANIGPHYARTLREWQRRFIKRFDDVIEPALREEHPELGRGEKGRKEVEIFRRKWICE